MLAVLSAFAGLLLLLLALKLTQRLTLRLKVLAGVTVSRNPQKSCPHLGHAADPFNHGLAPADEHRCYLYMQRDRIDLLHQKSFCLSTAHYKCPWLMIRRPDAPPPLRQRIRRALASGPRQAWELGLGGLRGVPLVASAAGRGLGRARGLARAAVRVTSHGLNTAVACLARAIRAVVGDLLHGLGAILGQFGGAVSNVSRDAWSQTQRGSTAVALLVSAVVAAFRAVGWAFGRLASALSAAFARVRAPREQRADQRAAMAELHSAPAPPEMAAAADLLSVPELVPEDRRTLAELFPGLDLSDLELSPAVAEAVAAAEPVLAQDLPLEPVLTSSSSAPVETPPDVLSQRLEAPLARFEELLARLESLVADGVSALDHGEETLAYQLFLKATEQKAKVPDRLAPELRDQHTSLMTRAWFWRAKTAETVEEVVDTLEQALRYEPGNLQIQAHLAWAKQRMERDQRVQQATAESLHAVDMAQLAQPQVMTASWRALGTAVRMAGGFMALALAALWMTTGVLPALGSWLSQLPAGDELMLRRLMLTINAAALPGKGHLPLPVVNYDLGLALPFVLAFLFVFTARGLMDGDNWARTTGLLLAGAGGWLCAAAVTNADAGRLGLILCVGIIVAAVLGRFETQPRRGLAEGLAY